MQKFTAACLLGVALLVFVSAGCFIANGSRGEKHTGTVTVRNVKGSGAFEFVRPNREIFEMSFDPSYLGPSIRIGDVLSDLIYVDTKDHRVFFVKAVLSSEAPVTDAILYAGEGKTYTCIGYGGCYQEQQNSVTLYRWKDGSYRQQREKADSGK